MLHRAPAKFPKAHAAKLLLAHAETLREWSFFWDWNQTLNQYRWMTSWATTTEDVDVFAGVVRSVLASS
jgi:threonine aldolase